MSDDLRAGDGFTTVLYTEHVGHHWRMRRDRMGERPRPEADTTVRWLRRELRRRRATLTRNPTVSLPQDCIDHWIYNVPCIRIDARAIIGGQDHGLPEILLTDSDAVAIPKDPRRPVPFGEALG